MNNSTSTQSPENPLNYNRYSYCLFSPLQYVDPSGEKIVPAGEKEAKAYYEFKANAPDHVQAELTRLEGAEEVFRIRMGDNITNTSGEGNFIYNPTTGEFDINIHEGGDCNTMEKLSHELKHGIQYLDREIGFEIKGNTASPIVYDKTDEHSAYTRQNLFRNKSEINVYQYVLENYRNLTDKSITIDNVKDPMDLKSMIYFNNINPNQPKFIYHGWQNDIKK